MEEVEQKVSLREKLLDKKTLLSFAVSFAILYLFLTRIDLGAAWEVMKNANPLLYLLAFVVYYAAYPIRGLRWKRLLENTGFTLGTRRRNRDPLYLLVCKLPCTRKAWGHLPGVSAQKEFRSIDVKSNRHDRR